MKSVKPCFPGKVCLFRSYFPYLRKAFSIFIEKSSDFSKAPLTKTSYCDIIISNLKLRGTITYAIYREYTLVHIRWIDKRIDVGVGRDSLLYYDYRDTVGMPVL